MEIFPISLRTGYYSLCGRWRRSRFNYSTAFCCVKKLFSGQGCRIFCLQILTINKLAALAVEPLPVADISSTIFACVSSKLCLTFGNTCRDVGSRELAPVLVFSVGRSTVDLFRCLLLHRLWQMHFKRICLWDTSRTCNRKLFPRTCFIRAWIIFMRVH